MGFRPLGDPVPRGQAYYVPMLVQLSDLGERGRQTRDALARTVQQEADQLGG